MDAVYTLFNLKIPWDGGILDWKEDQDVPAIYGQQDSLQQQPV